MKKMEWIFKLFLIIMYCTMLVNAQDKPRGEVVGSPKSGFRFEFLLELDDVESKIVSLAEAIPANKYKWRPDKGVRSVSEVFMHTGDVNYLLSAAVGVKIPDGVDRNMEKAITEKSKVIEFLKSSFEHIRKTVMKIPEGELDKSAKLFGRETTIRGILFNAALHLHEHLGQSIAYARINKIVPPWTAAEQARQQKNSRK
ncbi:MAG TPA: DinB family protein [Bacteroidota bacterium]|nr:DinB family protein [Bacteroidota bacterium]